MVGEQPNGAILSGGAIRRLLEGDRPLISGVGDPERQIQPNGIDLTLDIVWRPTAGGRLGPADEERVLAPRETVQPDVEGYYALVPGPYLGLLRETIDLPNDLMALGRPRSSLLRCGVALHTAVWDAGYRGRSEVLFVVSNPHGFRVRAGSRVLQLVFWRLDQATLPYRGAYQGENLE